MFRRLKLRIVLSNSQKAAQSLRQLALCLSLFVHGSGRHGSRAVSRDVFERPLLVSGVAFYGLNQIGNQVVTSLELHIDIAPG